MSCLWAADGSYSCHVQQAVSHRGMGSASVEGFWGGNGGNIKKDSPELIELQRKNAEQAARANATPLGAKMANAAAERRNTSQVMQSTARERTARH
jgi:hypothetical protein